MDSQLIQGAATDVHSIARAAGWKPRIEHRAASRAHCCPRDWWLRCAAARVLSERESSDNPPSLADATQSLTRTATELAGSGLRVDSMVRQGVPASEILMQVQSQGVDLIVMRTHGRVGLDRAVIGSVAERVLAHTTVPILTVRPGGRRLNRIERLVVPVDGSPGGRWR